MRVLVLSVLLLAGVCGLAGVARADDAAMLKKLIGTHALSLQWIDGKGTAEISATDGKFPLAITGKYDAGEKGAVELVGTIDRALADRFFFTGKITTTVSHINGGKPCTREGSYEFVAKGGRKYWRMYPIDNPCDKVADYVDVHFSATPKK